MRDVQDIERRQMLLYFIQIGFLCYRFLRRIDAGQTAALLACKDWNDQERSLFIPTDSTPKVLICYKILIICLDLVIGNMAQMYKKKLKVVSYCIKKMF